MTNNRLSIFMLAAALCMAAAPAYPADELFDSAMAAKHLEQGLSRLKAHNTDAAIKEFEKSVAIAPEAEAYYYLGYAYYLKSKKTNGENRRKSLENFEQAYEIDPGFSPVRYKPAEAAPQQTTKPATTEEPASGQSVTREQPES
jgi:Tfp pilus assembly protein PilF